MNEEKVQESLLRFVSVRTRERYPETRRIAAEAVRELARTRLEEHPEVLETYRRNRRQGEQEALRVAHALAEELAGRKAEVPETGKT